MRDVLSPIGAGLLRFAAAAWLLVLAPLDLAVTLARLATRSASTPAGLAVALIAARVFVSATGLVLGARIVQRTPGIRPVAYRWAVLDLVTLALALATTALPTSRVPGDAPFVWLVHAVAAVAVVRAAVR